MFRAADISISSSSLWLAGGAMYATTLPGSRPPPRLRSRASMPVGSRASPKMLDTPRRSSLSQVSVSPVSDGRQTAGENHPTARPRRAPGFIHARDHPVTTGHALKFEREIRRPLLPEEPI